MANKQSTNEGLRELALFAGAGGGILGGLLLGWRTVCAVEYDEHARNVLVARQNDGCLSPFPIWDDVRTFDGRPWRGRVDVVSGGFPCQDISIAGNGAGITGKRSGLWSEMFRIICEVRPPFAFVENSPMLLSRGIERVLGDLAEIGYDAEWCLLRASECGAPHERERFWLVGFDSDQMYAGRIPGTEGENLYFAQRSPEKALEERNGWEPELGSVDVAQRISSYSDALRVLHGMAHWMDRLERCGNGQVPSVAAAAWNILSGRTDRRNKQESLAL